MVWAEYIENEFNNVGDGLMSDKNHMLQYNFNERLNYHSKEILLAILCYQMETKEGSVKIYSYLGLWRPTSRCFWAE